MPSHSPRAKTATVLGLCVLFLGCTAPTADNPAADSAGSCEKIERLVAQYDQGFAAIKGHRTETRYGVVWKAQYDAVGKDCEVWEKTQSAPYYVCQQRFGDADTARARYRAAVEMVNGCLADDWQATEQTLAASQTRRTVFRRTAGKPDMVVRLVGSEGAMGRTNWRLFYLVGQAEDRAEWQAP